MPAFSYQAIDTEGLSRKGVLDAESARAARNMLRAQQLVPLSVELVGRDSGGLQRFANQSGSSLSLTSPITFGRRVFGASALMIWTRQLASLVSAH